MGYIVVRRGPESEQDYRDYLLIVSRRLLHTGVGLDRVPRVPTEGHADHWRYVSDEGEAKWLTEELRTRTENDGWEVRMTEETPSVGPLQPIVLTLGHDSIGVGLGLDSILAWALRLRYPGSAQHESVWVKTRNYHVHFTPEELRALALHFLTPLTGLSLDQLAVFGGFVIVNPVTEEVIVPFTPLVPSREEAQPADSPRRRESAASPDHCTTPLAG